MRAPRCIAPLTLVAALGSGCVHLDRNAPGVVNVHQPPPPRGGLKQPARQEPADPGEAMIMVLPGAMGGGGGLFTTSGSGGFAAVTAEATVLSGTRARSHSKPTLFPLPPIARHAFGGCAGLTTYVDPATGLGPIYLEGQYSYLGIFTASAGYAVDPTEGSHGPQVTLSAVGLYLRSTFLFGQATALQLGMMLKLPVTFVWSR